MSTNARVDNLSRGYSMRFKQAIRAIENCACEWVEFGKSVRDLTLAESISARMKQAKDREPLPVSELPNVVFRSPNPKQYREECGLSRDADLYFQRAKAEFNSLASAKVLQ